METSFFPNNIFAGKDCKHALRVRGAFQIALIIYGEILYANFARIRKGRVAGDVTSPAWVQTPHPALLTTSCIGIDVLDQNAGSRKHADKIT
jgi:hypothetical protein